MKPLSRHRLLTGLLLALAASSAGHAAELRRSDFQAPLAKLHVVQHFGEYLGVYEGIRYQGYHTGTDFRAGPGEPVHAISAGRVLRTGPLFDDPDDGGWYVEVQHPQLGVRSLYLHVGRPLVEAGQALAKGQVLAQVMQPKRFPAHLHMEIKCRDFEIVDPAGKAVSFVSPRTVPEGRLGYILRKSELRHRWLDPELFVRSSFNIGKLQKNLRNCASPARRAP